MPDTSIISPYVVRLGGGLILDRDSFSIPPGAAIQLQNFEPDIRGGYRRISGYAKYNSNIVPQTASADEPVLGVAIYEDEIIAARGEKVFKGGAIGSWTEIDSGRTSAGRYAFELYNMDNTEKILWCDGANHASEYDGTTVTDINGAGAPADPSIVALFKNHMFFGGMSANPQEVVFSAPYAPTSFSTGAGAGSIRVDSPVVQLKSFRDRLFIFCTDQIYMLQGSSVADFQLEPVTRSIGCLDGFSVQEIAGDLVYLAPDGLRTIAGTQKIADVELGTISKQVQDRLDNLTLYNISSCVIRNKSQYRLFYPIESQTTAQSLGIMGVIKANEQGGIGWEYADIKGMRPSCCFSGFIGLTETTIQGGFDGYVYEQETGNTFDGTAIVAIYTSPDHIMGDAGIRKYMQRIVWNYTNEGIVDATFRVRYDFTSSDTPQPSTYDLQTGGSVAIYGLAVSTYGTAVYGSSGTPLIRQTVEGSGFSVAIRVDDTSGNPPFSIKGYQLEFTPGGRR